MFQKEMKPYSGHENHTRKQLGQSQDSLFAYRMCSNVDPLSLTLIQNNNQRAFAIPYYYCCQLSFTFPVVIRKHWKTVMKLQVIC